MKTGRYTIYDLFNSTDIEQIIIPEIQRDYVWAQNNVEGLFNSIYENFRSKTEIVLEIKAENHEVDKAIQQHLQKEYYRLRFNTRIGFIYAYHNPDYADKYFDRRTTTYHYNISLIACRLQDKWQTKGFRQAVFCQQPAQDRL